MIRLLASALNSSDMSVLVDLPPGLLDKGETDLLEWVFEYRRKYNKLPEAGRVAREWPWVVPTIYMPSDPPRDEFDCFVTQRQSEKFASHLASLSKSVREDGTVVTPSMVTGLLKYTEKPQSSMLSLDEFELEWYEREGNALPFGISIVDKATGGLRDADYALIAGRPGTGKTIIGTWMAYRWWELGFRVLFVSKEMKPEDVFARIVAQVGMFNPMILRTPAEMTYEQRRRVLAARHLIKTKPKGKISVPRKSVSTPEDVQSLLEAYEYDVVIIDGLYLFMTRFTHAAKWERISDISNSLKRIANDTRTPIVGITQLKRGTGGDITTEDIAYSDSLGQDADFVLAIADTERAGEIQTLLTKNRHGEGKNIGAMLSVDFDKMSVTEGALEVDF